jgi:hypothetical protein
MQSLPVGPVTIGPANCELVTGVNWRYMRARYPQLLRRLGDRKEVILAADLAAELARPGGQERYGAEELAQRLGIERGAM